VGLSINYHPVGELPKFAWVACLDLKTFTEVSVFDGSSSVSQKLSIGELS